MFNDLWAELRRGTLQSSSPNKVIRNDRLGKLADHLQYNVKDDQYNSWGWRGCAAGHATKIPEFRELGIHIKSNGDGTINFACNGLTNMDAAMEFFHITNEQARRIFLSLGADRQATINHIRAIITE